MGYVGVGTVGYPLQGAGNANGAAFYPIGTNSGLAAHGVTLSQGTGAFTSVSPSATAGKALVSTGATTDPAYGTVGVAGGGTGVTSITGIVTGNGISGFTGSTVTQYGTLVAGASNLVSATSTGTSGQVLTSNGSGSAPTYQNASGVSQMGGVLPIFNNDSTYINGNISFSNTLSSISVADRALAFHPMLVGQSCTLNTLLCYGSGTAGSSVRMGLYSNSGGIPVTKLADSGQISTTVGSSIMESSALSVSLSPGWYWICLVADIAAGFVLIESAAFSSFPSWARIAGGTSVVKDVQSWIQSSVNPSSSLPSTAGTLGPNTGVQAPVNIFCRLTV